MYRDNGLRKMETYSLSSENSLPGSPYQVYLAIDVDVMIKKLKETGMTVESRDDRGVCLICRVHKNLVYNEPTCVDCTIARLVPGRSLSIVSVCAACGHEHSKTARPRICATPIKWAHNGEACELCVCSTDAKERMELEAELIGRLMQIRELTAQNNLLTKRAEVAERERDAAIGGAP